MTSYADLRQLRQLPAAPDQRVAASSHPQRGAGGTDRVADVRITNTSSTADGRLLPARRPASRRAAGVPAAGDNELLPVFWDRNDTTLWPGESETLHVGLPQRAAGRRLAGGLGQRRQRRRDRRPRRLTALHRRSSNSAWSAARNLGRGTGIPVSRG